MRNIILVMITLSMVMLAVACDDKGAKSEKDASSVSCSDATKSGDATELADTATLTDAEKKDDCYSGCLGTDMSKEDCKKACNGKWTKDAGSSSKEADVSTPDAVDAPSDVTPQG